jgi:hypothetical protein
MSAVTVFSGRGFCLNNGLGGCAARLDANCNILSCLRPLPRACRGLCCFFNEDCGMHAMCDYGVLTWGLLACEAEVNAGRPV